MAKVSMVNREDRRTNAVKRDEGKRAALRQVLKDVDASYDDKINARDALNKLPRDGSYTRMKNRCSFTGRPRGYHRQFGVSRNVLREMAAKGMLPGVRKASW